MTADNNNGKSQSKRAKLLCHCVNNNIDEKKLFENLLPDAISAFSVQLSIKTFAVHAFDYSCGALNSIKNWIACKMCAITILS